MSGHTQIRSHAEYSCANVNHTQTLSIPNFLEAAANNEVFAVPFEAVVVTAGPRVCLVCTEGLRGVFLFHVIEHMCMVDQEQQGEGRSEGASGLRVDRAVH